MNFQHKKSIRLLEFFIVGVFMGISEDVLAIALATDARITMRVLLVVITVALPFAFVSEFIVDHPRFWETIFRRK